MSTIDRLQRLLNAAARVVSGILGNLTVADAVRRHCELHWFTGGPENWTVDIEKRSIYQTAQFFIWSKTGVLRITAFKYSLRNFSVTTLR